MEWGKIIVAVLVLVIARWYSWNNENDVNKISLSWALILKDANVSFKDVLIGINGNVDLITRAVPLMAVLEKYPGGKLTAPNPQDLASLGSLQDLIDVFTYYFRRGNAAERNFQHRSSFDEVISAADELQKEHNKYSVGGNAALMARNIANRFPSVKVRFIGPVGPRLAQLLPESVVVPVNSRRTTDEIHMILEYSVGEVWNEHSATVATRFITSYDEANSKADGAEQFFTSVNDIDGSADVIVFSGLHLLDSLENEVAAQRLQAVLDGLSHRRENAAPIHLELASMANPVFITRLLEEVLPLVTSIGLNEQELSVLSAVGGGPHKHLADSLKGSPPVHFVGDMLEWLMSRKNSQLSRVHFHCLSYHVLVANDNWSQLEQAVTAAVRVAGLQACSEENFSQEKFTLKPPLSTSSEHRMFSDSHVFQLRPSQPVYVERRNQLTFVFSPVLVCKRPLKTVGLGDAISSTGLMYSSYRTI